MTWKIAAPLPMLTRTIGRVLLILFLGPLGLAFILTLCGCVSLGYHQRCLKEAKDTELRNVRALIKDVKLKNISVYTLDDLVKKRLYDIHQDDDLNKVE